MLSKNKIGPNKQQCDIYYSDTCLNGPPKDRPKVVILWRWSSYYHGFNAKQTVQIDHFLGVVLLQR